MTNDSHNRITGITLNKIGKKFRDQWIFKNIDLEIKESEKIAITGSNGSGKSTFLQLLAGYVTPSEGKMTWTSATGQVDTENIYKHISFSSPYMDLIDD